MQAITDCASAVFGLTVDQYPLESSGRFCTRPSINVANYGEQHGRKGKGSDAANIEAFVIGEQRERELTLEPSEISRVSFAGTHNAVKRKHPLR